MSNIPVKQDLNLLFVLKTLLEERSVKKTAARLFVTPSAIRKSLHRLRERFDDDLFISRGEGLIPTRRADELEPILKQIFSQVETCFTSANFDPKNITATIRIAAPEQFSYILVPKLLLHLRKLAPNLTLDSQHLDDNFHEHLSTGSLDFAVCIEPMHPENFSIQKIYTATPLYLSRKDHPIAAIENITLSDILSYPQISCHTQNLSKKDLRLLYSKIDNAGLHVDVLFDTNHFLIALDVLLKTDALMMAPDYISLLPFFEGSLSSKSVMHLPAFDHLRMDLSLVQHKRTFKSALHQWVFNEISNLFKAG